MNLLLGLLIVLLVLVSLLLILVILMQRPRQEGIGATFGSNITESVFGVQASNVLEKGTVWLAALFFVLTITIAAIYNHRSGIGSLQQKLRMEPVTASEPQAKETTPESSTAADAPAQETTEAAQSPAPAAQP